MATIREAHPEDALSIAHVHINSWRTTYAGVVPDTVLDNMRIEDREARWVNIMTEHARYNFTYVALEAGRIVGFASGGPERDGVPDYDGELFAIYLLQSAQGKGIGRQLTMQIARHLQEESFSQMIVWVLADNQAVQFYKALGAQYVTDKQIIISGKTLKEHAYGWSSINTFLKEQSKVGKKS